MRFADYGKFEDGKTKKEMMEYRMKQVGYIWEEEGWVGEKNWSMSASYDLCCDQVCANQTAKCVLLGMQLTPGIACHTLMFL